MSQTGNCYAGDYYAYKTLIVYGLSKEDQDAFEGIQISTLQCEGGNYFSLQICIGGFLLI